MDLSTISVAEALRLVAERRVYAMLKTADRASAVASAQDARARLGLLGTPEGPVNEAVTGFNKGILSRGTAKGRISGATPGSAKQLANVPSAIGKSLEQGRPEEALNQADVLGLKNVTNPFAAGAALTAGGGAHALHGAISKGRKMNDLLRGGLGAEGDTAMAGAVARPKLDAWKDWHQQPSNMNTDAGSLGRVLESGRKAVKDQKPVNYGSMNKHVKHPGYRQPGRLSSLRAGLGAAARTGAKELFGPGETHLKGTASPTVNLSRRELLKAVNLLPKSTASKLMSFGLPAAAAVAPLAAREWLLPGGYRSGKAPAGKLLDANSELQQPAARK